MSTAARETIAPTANGAGTVGGSGTAGAVDLAVELRLACQRIARRIRYESAGDEAAPHQIGVLFRLSQRPSTPTELADWERVSAPAMSRTLNGLVERGYADRSPHPTDGRQVVLTLTDAGAALLQRSRAARDQWMRAHLDALPEEELAVLRRATRILAQVAEA